MRLTLRSLGAGALALLARGLFAALAPTGLGIDHRGLLSIVGAGDHTALNLKLHDGTTYPLTRLVIYAAIAGALALIGARLLRNDPSAPGAGTRAGAGPGTTDAGGTDAGGTDEGRADPGRRPTPGPSGSPAVSGY
jgi:hypothetical protein